MEIEFRLAKLTGLMKKCVTIEYFLYIIPYYIPYFPISFKIVKQMKIVWETDALNNENTYEGIPYIRIPECSIVLPVCTLDVDHQLIWNPGCIQNLLSFPGQIGNCSYVRIVVFPVHRRIQLKNYKKKNIYIYIYIYIISVRQTKFFNMFKWSRI